AVLVCAAIFGPNGPHGVPDPTITDASPRPDFYFLSLFALLALLPPWTETVILLVGMPLAIVFLLALPLFAGTGEKSWRRRPVAGRATRLTRDQLIREVLQGGGNMPAYGKNLAPAEVNALVAFLETLRPTNQPPARTPVAARPAPRPE